MSLPNLRPQWPTPLSSSGQSGDLSFIERLFNAVFGTLFLDPLFSRIIHVADPSYDEVLQGIDTLSYFGVHVPLLINTVLGFDFPTPRYPLVEYVGPVFMQSLPHLDQDLQEWLDSKEERAVIYISMGTTGSLEAKKVQALLDGVMETSYNAMWVMKTKNRDKLGVVNFAAFEDRLFLADWAPQQTVLQHNSIVMSILHCGLNGVQESLSNSLPVICMPLGYDQFEVAAKVVSAGVGLSMYNGFMDSLKGNREVKAKDIETSVYKIVSGNYAENASRIRRMYKLAGGAKRAADLVEYYEDVGYEHLVPAFAKYEWSWIQRNNWDVWLVFAAMCCGVGWVWWRVGRWCFSKLGC